MEIINVYAQPNASEANTFLDTHQTAPNALIAGDFNTHHAMWYAEKVTASTAVIPNGRTKASGLIRHIDNLGLTLQNVAGTYTHSPRASKYYDTIPDITLTRGHTTTITNNWSCELHEGGHSDH